MKKLLVTFVALFLVLTLCACNKVRHGEITGSGDLQNKEYTNLIGTELELNNICVKHDGVQSACRLYIFSSNEKKIVITSQQEIIDSISVTSTDGKIKIIGDTKKYYDTDYVKVEVYGYTFKELDLDYVTGEITGTALAKNVEIEISSASNMKLSGHSGDELDIEVSGASTFTFNDVTTAEVNVEASGASTINAVGLEASNLEVEMSGASNGTLYTNGYKTIVEMSGASDLTLNGKATRLEIEVSGASRLSAREYVVQDSDVEVSGASVAQITVSGTLRYDISGASALSYKGNPELLGETVTGNSTVSNDN